MKAINFILAVLLLCACGADQRDRLARDYIRQAAKEKNGKIESLEFVKKDTILGLAPLIFAERDIKQAGDDYSYGVAKYKAGMLLVDYSTAWNAMEGLPVDSIALKRIKSDPKYEWRWIYRYKMVTDKGKLLDVDVIFDTEGIRPDMLGADYSNIIREIDLLTR